MTPRSPPWRCRRSTTSKAIRTCAAGSPATMMWQRRTPICRSPTPISPAAAASCSPIGCAMASSSTRPRPSARCNTWRSCGAIASSWSSRTSRAAACSRSTRRCRCLEGLCAVRSVRLRSKVVSSCTRARQLASLPIVISKTCRQTLFLPSEDACLGRSTGKRRDMDPFLRRRIGKTSLEVTQLGMGGASLGDMREVVSEAQASAAIEAAHAAGIGYFDTSPWYGNGKSELRFGHVLATKPRDSFVLSTKVGRVHQRPAAPDTYRHPGWAGGLPFEPRFDYTRDGVLRSYEMSLARLGLNRVEALLIHDLDPRFHKSEEGV